MNVVAGQSFYILVTNLIKNWTEVRKHMLNEIADGNSQCVVHMTADKNIYTPVVVEKSGETINEQTRTYDPINSKKYKEAEDFYLRRDRRKNV